MTVDRVSFTSNQLLLKSNLNRVQVQYREAAEPATTGLRVNHLSDDSNLVARIFSIRNQVSENDEYQKNIGRAQLYLDYADNQLTQTSDTLERLHDIALTASNPIADLTSLQEIGRQFDTLKEQILNYANARQDDRYIFAGSKTTTKPFTGDPVVFNGNSLDFMLNITASVRIDTNLDGQNLFLGDTDTATSTSTATSLRNTNGVPLGLQAGDVISVGGSVGSALSGTMTVTSTTTLADVASFMQTRLRAAGDNTETVAVQPDGSLRVTSGASAISNLNLSVSGKSEFNTAFTFPTTITGAGGTGSSAAIDAGDNDNVFDVIDDLRDAITSADSAGIQTHMARLESVTRQINGGRTQIATRSQQVIASQNFLEDEGLRLLQHLSDLQDADVAEAFTTLTTRESALKLVLASSTRFLNTINNIDLLS